MKDLAGATAVVTGGAGGIGRALAVQFSDNDMNVVLADIDDVALTKAGEDLTQLGARVLAVPTDVSNSASVNALADSALARFGRVDIICNNAGVVASGRTWEVPPQEWARIMAINFMGVVHGIRTFVPLLRSQNRGHVINTASMAGVTVGAGLGPYAASKHAVVALSETLHKELLLEDSAVKVSVLCPGMVRTAMPDRAISSADNGSLVATTLVDDAVRAVSASAISVENLARQVLAAVIAERFWIFTHPERMFAVTERAEGMARGTNPKRGYP